METFRQARTFNNHTYCYKFEATDLPGSGWRCANRQACQGRVRAIVAAHQQLSAAGAAADAECVPLTADALAAELRSRGWVVSTDVVSVGQTEGAQ